MLYIIIHSFKAYSCSKEIYHIKYSARILDVLQDQIITADYKGIYQPMFESRTEKGLFTFYWQQLQTGADSQMHSARKSRESLSSNTEVLSNWKEEMEEKKLTKYKSHKLGIKPKTQKIEEILNHSTSSKENLNKKRRKQMVTVDLSPILSKELEDRAFRMVTNQRIKDKLTELTTKKSCDLPLLFKQDSDRSKSHGKRSKQQQIFDKLIKGELSLEPSRFNLQISEEVTNSNGLKRQPRSTRAKKTLKSDKILKKINKTQRNQKLDCNCLFADKQAASYRFPKLYPHQKSLKRQKEPYLLQKIMLNRQQIDRSSSVINLGIDSCQEYRSRWERKKADFLKILAKNMSDNSKQ